MVGQYNLVVIIGTNDVVRCRPLVNENKLNQDESVNASGITTMISLFKKRNNESLTSLTKIYNQYKKACPINKWQQQQPTNWPTHHVYFLENKLRINNHI